MDLYRRTLRELGMDDAAIARNVDQCWVWRNVFVAETDAEAERIALPAFEAMHEHRTAMRKRVYEEQGVSIVPMPAPGTAPAARMVVEHSLIYGSPATVAEKLAQVDAIGVGGVIMQFRLGPMSYDDVAQSLTLFMRKVAPDLLSLIASVIASERIIRALRWRSASLARMTDMLNSNRD